MLYCWGVELKSEFPFPNKVDGFTVALFCFYFGTYGYGKALTAKKLVQINFLHIISA